MRGGLILAGGKSRRFGEEKCLLEVLGKILVEWVIERLSFLDELRIALRYGQRLPERIEIPVSYDSGEVGPLGGILEALKEMRSEFVFITACDMPMIRRDAVELLFSLSSSHDAVLPEWSSGYIEPLHAIYRREAMIRACEEALRKGERRISSAISRLQRVLRFPAESLPKESFFNLNTEEDLKELIKLLREERREEIDELKGWNPDIKSRRNHDKA